MFTVDQILPLFILIPFFGVLFIAVLSRKNKFLADVIMFLTVSLLLIVWADLFVFLSHPATVVYPVGGWPVIESITFVLDGLALFMLGAVYMVCFCLMLFCLSFIESAVLKWKFYSLFLLLLTGISGTLISGDIFTMYLFMELSAICSYSLVVFTLKGQALTGGFKFMIKGMLSSALILLAIAVCYSYTATLSFADISSQLYSRKIISSDPGLAFVVVFIQALFFTGFAVKSGIFPLNSWLPRANQQSIPPVSALLCAVVVPVLGIYPFVRIYFNVVGTSPDAMVIVRAVGVLSILGGLLWALKKTRLKCVIGFHTMSEYGFALMGLGIGTSLGILGGLLHIFNTQVSSSIACCNSGLPEYVYGIKSKYEPGISFLTMPMSCVSTVLGNLAFVGGRPDIKCMLFAGSWRFFYRLFPCFQNKKIFFSEVRTILIRCGAGQPVKS